jgi:hypothetical protein
MVRLSLWQIGQLISYVKALFNLNIIRHIKLNYSIRLTFQNLQRANMSSTKHACGGTCQLDSQLLTASTFHTKLFSLAFENGSKNPPWRPWYEITIEAVFRSLIKTHWNQNEAKKSKNDFNSWIWIKIVAIILIRQRPNWNQWKSWPPNWNRCFCRHVCNGRKIKKNCISVDIM